MSRLIIYFWSCRDVWRNHAEMLSLLLMAHALGIFHIFLRRSLLIRMRTVPALLKRLPVMYDSIEIVGFPSNEPRKIRRTAYTKKAKSNVTSAIISYSTRSVFESIDDPMNPRRIPEAVTKLLRYTGSISVSRGLFNHVTISMEGKTTRRQE